MQAVKLLQTAMQHENPTDALDFLYSGSETANMWLTRMQRMAESLGSEEAAEDVFKEIFNSINRGEKDAQIVGRIFQTNSKTGFMHEHEIQETDALKRLYERFKGSGETDIDKFLENYIKKDDPDALKVQQELKTVNTKFLGNYEDLEKLTQGKEQKYLEARLAINEKKLKISELDDQIKELLKRDSLGLTTEKDSKKFQELTAQRKSLEESIGDKDAFKNYLDTEQKLLDAQKDLEKAKAANNEAGVKENLEKITELTKQKELIEKTAEYQAALIGNELEKIKTNENQNLGKNVRKLVDSEANARLADEEEAIKKAKKASKESLISDIEEYKKIASSSYRAEKEAELAEKRLEEEEKAVQKRLEKDGRTEQTEEEKEALKRAKESAKEARREARRLKAQRTKYGKVIKDEQKDLYRDQGGKNVFTDINGDVISKEEATRRGYYLSVDQYNKETGKEEGRAAEYVEHRQITAVQNKILQYYEMFYKFEEQIADIGRKIEEQQEKGNTTEVERLTKLKETLVLQKAKESEMEKFEFQKMDGYSLAVDDEMKEVAFGRHQIRLLQKKKDEDSLKLREMMSGSRGRSGSGGGSGSSFLGIDAGVTRWISRLMSGGMIYRFIAMIKRGLKDITQKAKQLDQAMTNLRIVTGKSADDARTLINQYAKLGKELGATTLEVTQAATAWARQGYDMYQVSELVRSSMYLSKLGMIDANEAVKDLTSSMHGFKIEASDAMSNVDKLTALDVKAATTAGDIAQGLSQFANIANLNGVSIDQAAAYVATIADVNQASGATVGQALKTIMSRYGNVKAGAYNKLNVDSENEDTSEKLNDVERILTKMGISIRKTNLEFKDFDEVMDNIAEKWETMDNVSKKAIANAFAGIRQQESFLILAENYDKYKGLLEVSENSKGTAERKYQSYKESYAAARNELTATLERIANSSEISKLLTTLTKQLTGILDFFQGAYKFFPAILSALSYLRTIQGKNIFQTAARMWDQRKQGNNGFGGQNIDGSTRNPFARMRNKFADVRAGMRAREYGKMGDDEKFQQRKEKLQKQDAKYQKQLQDRDMKYRQKILKNTEKELINKKSILNMAEQEALKKEIVTNEAEDQKTLESVKSTLMREGLLVEGEKLTYEKAIAIQESGVLKDREAGNQLEDIIAKNRTKGAQMEVANNAANAKTKFRAAGGLNGNTGFMKGITVASSIANTLTTAFSQFSTAANTHEYGGETVESSKEAQKAGSRASAVISMLPFLGSVIGPIVGEKVAARIDMQRDIINYSSKKSTENLNILKGIDNSLEQIQSTEANSLERSKVVKEFKTQIFDEENKELRKMLQKHLGNDNLSSVLNSINILSSL